MLTHGARQGGVCGVEQLCITGRLNAGLDSHCQTGDDPAKAAAVSAYHLGQDDRPATSDRPAAAPHLP